MRLTIVESRPELGKEITPPRVGDKFWWNPSITKHKKDVFVSFRGYEKNPSIWRAYTSPLAVGKLIDDEVVGLKTLKPLDVSGTVKDNGVEDVRIWSDGDNLLGIGVVLFKQVDARGIERAGVKQALISIDYENGTYSMVKEYDSPKGLPEKNWSPIDGKPYEYHYAIGEVYKDGHITVMDWHQQNVSLVHNGTPLIKFGDEYIGVFHQRVMLTNRIYRYPNIFIKFNSDLKPIKQSNWFVFGDYKNEEVQFISGAMKVNKDIMALTVGLDRITSHTDANYKGLLYHVDINNIEFKDFDYNNLVITRGTLQ